MNVRFKKFAQRYWVAVAIMLLLVTGLCYESYRNLRLQRETEALRAESASLRSSVEQLQHNVSLTAYERDRLTFVLDQTQQDTQALQEQTQALQGKVSEYQKLQSIDPELLKKYSKVYFLNEQYVPSSLAAIDPAFVSGTGKQLQFHTQALPYLNSLLHDATTDGVALRIASAYRSFGTQATLKSTYKVIYGAGTANAFSADQGYSEHQLGTAVDFATAKNGTLSSAFESTPESRWLLANAYRYGFVLSYPKNNKYYIYEPWHWRFVGVALATHLHDAGAYLYDMDQRDIDPYLLHIFD